MPKPQRFHSKNLRNCCQNCKILIPKFEVPKGETEKTYLHKSVYRGLAWRYGNTPEDVASEMTVTVAKKTLPTSIAERAAYELGVIDSMGFNGYFLIISDFVNWGKNEGIVYIVFIVLSVVQKKSK